MSTRRGVAALSLGSGVHPDFFHRPLQFLIISIGEFSWGQRGHPFMASSRAPVEGSADGCQLLVPNSGHLDLGFLQRACGAGRRGQNRPFLLALLQAALDSLSLTLLNAFHVLPFVLGLPVGQLVELVLGEPRGNGGNGSEIIRDHSGLRLHRGGGR